MVAEIASVVEGTKLDAADATSARRTNMTVAREVARRLIIMEGEEVLWWRGRIGK